MTAQKSKYFNRIMTMNTLLFSLLTVGFSQAYADVVLEKQVKITDDGLHFDGKDLNHGNIDSADPGEKYDFFFGPNISAHGDAVKTYKHYVFMTWYKGGKSERNVMLSRYNTQTQTIATIEFPHRHTGFRGNPLIGESHNTIGLAVSPNNGTIHMVYDLHAYDDNNHDGKFKDDFFRYSFSVENAADLPDDQFTLDKFVKDTSSISQGPDDYKHISMTGDIADKSNFARLTYPKFFTTTDGTLLLYMRLGGNNNGAYVFNRYDEETQTWSKFTKFNENNQKNFGNPYNWGLYGNMKYVNGKLRVGFQQRSSDNNDRYQYQNGVYYAYSDHPEGFGDWKNHKDDEITYPLVNSDEIKVLEPGDYISHQEANSVYIVGSFDWTVTKKGDVHFISKVRSTNRSRPDYEEEYLHSYKPAGADEFITTTDFTGASQIYTAGDNIYIVGLKNGRPYVERAKGGTNDFVRVYEATSGPVFDHGTLYIKDGKVYYYLMEKTSGNAMPLYLQIIDLDLESEANAPQVAFPSTSLTVEQGYEQLSLGIDATSSIEGRTIESVTLYLNDELVRTDTTVPYLFGHASKPHETGAMGWKDEHEPNPNPLGPGEHIFKAVAVDSEGDTGLATMRLTVQSNAPMVSFPTQLIEVDEGYEKLSVSVDASSSVEGRTIESVTLFINGEEVRTDTTIPYLWGHGSKPHETGAMGWREDHAPNPNPFLAGEYVFTAIATDSQGEQSETSMTLIVNGEATPPIVTWPNEVVTVTEGYKRLGITIEAEASSENATIESVTLYRNDELVRVDTKYKWNFGHSFAPYEFGAMGWLETHEPNPSPLLAGTHTFKVVAKDSTGLEGEAFMTLIVLPPAGPSISFDEPDIELMTGYESLSVSTYVATVNESVDIISVALFIDDVLVRENLEAPYVWGDANHPNELLSLEVGSYEFKAIARDTNDQVSEVSLLVSITLFGDFDGDNDVDRTDVRAFSSAIRSGEALDQRYDFNEDGVVDRSDTRGLTKICSRPRCAS
ncbi:BNR-4 repeat-containing protein [Glaciecola sp. KUL10]|uniref:Ulvan lyase, long isoform n=1 Tax=Glaciecola sp. (strain KUL10) TaxID=2161813 RepID=UL24L_GLASK|nr:RecName: Full=Ulvan lyase, long isoform; AltName: Full=Ulvan lyase A; Flags: Precursor [Glaciecola sp. KUL10]BAY00693.1 ulvan lyase [Glaciecola sp.]GBL04955.1 fibronectin type III domain protein [Glaciecola sp. KUL10]